MKNLFLYVIGWCTRLLASYDYHSATCFFESLAPSFRYSVTKPLLLISIMFFPVVEATLGISGAAFIAMILAFTVELTSGLMASQISKQQLSSFRASRFTFKVFIYIVIIAVPFHWAQSFEARHKEIMAAAFDWLQNTMIVQITFENTVSILENLAVITGKDKTALINKLKDKLTGLL